MAIFNGFVNICYLYSTKTTTKIYILIREKSYLNMIYNLFRDFYEFLIQHEHFN